MKSISLYVERDTLIHHIDPISKIVYIFAAIAIPLILPTIPVSLFLLLFSLALLSLAKVLSKTLPVFGFVLFILLTVVIIQGMFKAENETVFFQLGPLTFYEEGLHYALILSLRVLNIVAAVMLLVLTTKPSDLVESLVRRGLSPRIGYVLASVFQIIPQMTATMGAITDAQRSRGMETEGKLSVRIKAFFPLIVPVVMNALISTKERAMALEVRGFNADVQKTYLNEEKTYASGKYIKIVLLLAVVAAIVWRFAA